MYKSVITLLWTHHFFLSKGQVEELIWHVHFQHKSCHRYWVSNTPSIQCKFLSTRNLDEKCYITSYFYIGLPFESSSTNSQHLWTILAMDIFISDRLYKNALIGVSSGDHWVVNRMAIFSYLGKGSNIFIQVLPCFFIETNFDNCNQNTTEWHGIVIDATVLF